MMRSAPTISLLVAGGLAACVPGLPEGDLAHPFDGGAPVSGKGGSAGGGASGGTDAAVLPPGSFTLVAKAGRPRNVAYGRDIVYWVNRDTKTLMNILAKPGSSPVPVMGVDVVNSPDTWVAAYGGAVYWSDGANGVPTDIMLAADNAAAAGPIVSGSEAINQIVATADGVFWTTAAGKIMAMGPGGANLRALASGIGDVRALAVDGSSVYWTGVNGAFKVAISGGGPIALAGPAGSPSVAVDANYFYWVNPAQLHDLSLDGPTPDGPIMKVGLDGRNPRVAFNYGASIRGTCLATSSDRVYYGDTGGTAHVVSPAEGFEWTFGSMGAAATSIVVGATSVFWAVDAPVDSIVGAPR